MVSPSVLRILFSQPEAPDAAAKAYLARTINLGQPYRDLLTSLINGLVADGSWPLFDLIYIFANQDQTNALLNLCSSNFSATLTGTPTFVPAVGYTGLITASNFVNGIAPTLLTEFQQNSAHISVWLPTGLGSQNAGVIVTGGVQNITPDNTGSASCRINISASAASGTTSNSGRGFYMGVRSNSTLQTLYVNGASVGTDSGSSIAKTSSVPQIPQSTKLFTISAVTYGADVTSYQSQIYNRFATYMSALGILP